MNKQHLKTFWFLAGLAAILLAACSPQGVAPTVVIPIPPAPTSAEQAGVSSASGAIGGTPSEAAASAPSETGARKALLAIVANSVMFRSGPDDIFVAAIPGQALPLGAQVLVGPGSQAILGFSEGTAVYLDENTLFTLQEMTTDQSDPRTTLFMDYGKLWIVLNGGELSVETPIGMAAVRGSYESVAYQNGTLADVSDDQMVVTCLEGTCTVADQQQTSSLQVPPGQQSNIAGPQSSPATPAPMSTAQAQEWLTTVPPATVVAPPEVVAAGGGAPTPTNEAEFTGVVTSATANAIVVGGQEVSLAGVEVQGPVEVGQIVKVHVSIEGPEIVVAREVNVVDQTEALASDDSATESDENDGGDANSNVAAGASSGNTSIVAGNTNANANANQAVNANESENGNRNTNETENENENGNVAFNANGNSNGNSNTSNGEVEFSGTVSAVDNGFIVVAGQTVFLGSGTEVKGNMAVGQVVKVHAFQDGNGQLSAREVEVQGDATGGNGNGNTGNGNDNANDNANDNVDDNSNENDNGNSNSNDNGSDDSNDNGNNNDNGSDDSDNSGSGGGHNDNGGSGNDDGGSGQGGDGGDQNNGNDDD